MLKISRRSVIKGGLAFGFLGLTGIKLSPEARAEDAALKGHMEARIDSVYKADKGFEVRSSQDNIQVQKLYKDFLGEPGGDLSHKLLHMEFKDRSNNIKKLAGKEDYPNPRKAEFDTGVYPYE